MWLENACIFPYILFVFYVILNKNVMSLYTFKQMVLVMDIVNIYFKARTQFLSTRYLKSVF